MIILKRINLLLGNALERAGYKVCKASKFPSQHLAPVELAAALLKCHKAKHDGLRIVQIGAFDGLLADPIKNLLNRADVSAVLVEPQPQPYQKLKHKFEGRTNIQIVNAAVYAQTGEVDMYTNDLVSGSPTASLSSKHIQKFGGSRSQLSKITVKSLSPKDLLDRVGWDSFDLLQVDTEGFDWQLIQLFFDTSIDPAIVNFERIHLTEAESIESKQILKSKGYYWIDTEYDCLAFKTFLTAAT